MRSVKIGDAVWQEHIAENDFLGGLVQASSQPIVVGFWDGSLGLCNNAFEELTGYSAEELRNVTWDKTLTPPEWREMERAKLREQLITRQPIRYEKEYIRKDGTRVPIELLVHLVPDSDGNPKFYYTFLTDITERKQAQESLRRSDARWNTAIDNLREGVVIGTNTGSVIYWNPSARAMHGYSNPADGIQPLEDFPKTFELSDAETGRILPLEEWPLSRVMRGEVLRNLEIRIRRFDQDWARIVSYCGSILETLKGERLCFLSIFDLTERKRAEMALSESARRKDEFLAMLGHELRNPLAAIRHAVYLAKDSPKDLEAIENSIQVIDRQSAQLSRMVEDLLDLARIDKGRIELRREHIDIRTVLERAVSAAQPLMTRKGHACTSKLPGISLVVYGDAARLEQVFVNLLNNAAKYTHDGGAVEINAEKSGEDAVVTVRDNGSGIHPALLPHIFDPFTQGETSLDRAEGGLGIGLTVVRALIGLHGGSITAESAGVNAGATFTVRFPLAQEVHSKSVTDTSGNGAGSHAEIHDELRILIVDDHVDGVETLAKLLTRRGAIVRMAHDGPRAVVAAMEFKPDVLLLDIGLPGYNGYELAHSLKVHPILKNSLFIAITGYAAERDEKAALEAGFDCHFGKPVEFGALWDCIRSKRR